MHDETKSVSAHCQPRAKKKKKKVVKLTTHIVHRDECHAHRIWLYMHFNISELLQVSALLARASHSFSPTFAPYRLIPASLASLDISFFFFLSFAHDYFSTDELKKRLSGPEVDPNWKEDDTLPPGQMRDENGVIWQESISIHREKRTRICLHMCLCV